MKTITAEQQQRLEDLSAERLLKPPLAIAETDVHVTDLLKALSELVVAHDGFKDLDKRREATRVCARSCSSSLSSGRRSCPSRSEPADISTRA